MGKAGRPKGAKGKDDPKQIARYWQSLTYNELVAQLFTESRIDNAATKMALCEAVAALRFELKILLKRQAENEISIAEVRSIPAIASNMRRLLEQLGTATPSEETFDF